MMLRRGTIESTSDFDAFFMYLVSGVQYDFFLDDFPFPSGTANPDAFFRLYSPGGTTLLGESVSVPINGGTVEDLLYTAPTSGFYFVQVVSGNNVGSYYLNCGTSFASYLAPAASHDTAPTQ